MTTEIAEYSQTEAALATLSERYKGVVYDVTKKEGMEAAVKARAELRGYRVSLEKTRVEIKAPALKRSQAIDSEARRITAALVALEDPIDEQIKAETDKKKRAEEAAAKAEADRIAAEERARKEAEEAKLAAERAEIARQRIELEKAEKARLEADRQARLKIEEEQRAARLKIEQEERAARAAREEADRQDRLARQARDEVARIKAENAAAALKAERDRLDAERRAIEEAEEAAFREKQRLANELNDGYEMLATFVRRFGKREEFRAIVKAIGPYLRKAA